jgi:hypothetical protein
MSVPLLQVGFYEFGFREFCLVFRNYHHSTQKIRKNLVFVNYSADNRSAVSVDSLDRPKNLVFVNSRNCSESESAVSISHSSPKFSFSEFYADAARCHPTQEFSFC